jgi:SAM-dependent methyltransferase
MFTLDRVVPWGRSFEEYGRMFLLDDRDLASRILGCGDGPASFNAVATRNGATVTSCDPIYRWPAGDIEQRIAVTYDQVLEQTRQNAGQFVWDDAIPSVEALGRVRMTAMRAFLADYEQGRAAGRYVDAELPALPFPDASFDLALCSHLLFLYSAQLDEAFHRAAVLELARVSSEVRIFPLLALDGQRSPHLSGTVDALVEAGCSVSIESVPYEFQSGGNQMMRIRVRHS